MAGVIAHQTNTRADTGDDLRGHGEPFAQANVHPKRKYTKTGVKVPMNEQAIHLFATPRPSRRKVIALCAKSAALLGVSGCGFFINGDTTTTLTTSAASATVGTSVTFTATLAPTAATGTVTFYNGTTSLGTGTLTAGVATLALSTLTVGTYHVTAAYSGDTIYTASTSPAVTVTISAVASLTTSSTTLALSASSATFGSSVTLTATVAPSAATGSVTFYEGATIVGTQVLVSGVATLATTALPAGDRIDYGQVPGR